MILFNRRYERILSQFWLFFILHRGNLDWMKVLGLANRQLEGLRASRGDFAPRNKLGSIRIWRTFISFINLAQSDTVRQLMVPSKFLTIVYYWRYTRNSRRLVPGAIGAISGMSLTVLQDIAPLCLFHFIIFTFEGSYDSRFVRDHFCYWVFFKVRCCVTYIDQPVFLNL